MRNGTAKSGRKEENEWIFLAATIQCTSFDCAQDHIGDIFPCSSRHVRLQDDRMTHSSSPSGHTWKVGELADQTGLTVRTLHYYEELGLLSPSHRTASEHRLYTEQDLARLQQIVSLKSLGMSLGQIKQTLDQPTFSPAMVIDLQTRKAEEQLREQQELVEKLKGLKRLLDYRKPVSAQDFLQIIAMTSKMDTYFTPEQQEEIKQRGKELGEEKIIEAERDWQSLIQAVQKEMDAGAGPADPRALALAKKWKGLIEAFTGGNPAIANNLQRMYKENAQMSQTFGGPSPEMSAYIGQAMAAMREKEGDA